MMRLLLLIGRWVLIGIRFGVLWLVMIVVVLFLKWNIDAILIFSSWLSLLTTVVNNLVGDGSLAISVVTWCSAACLLVSSWYLVMLRAMLKMIFCLGIVCVFYCRYWMLLLGCTIWFSNLCMLLLVFSWVSTLRDGCMSCGCTKFRNGCVSSFCEVRLNVRVMVGLMCLK